MLAIFARILAIAVSAGLLIFTAAAPARSAEIAAEIGLKVGSSIPQQLAGAQSGGALRDFDRLAGPKGLVLYFVRSVDWCPYCRAQTLSIDGARKEFAARGLSVAVVSYDSPEKQNAFATDRKLHVTLISDPKSEIIDAFGLRNERHISGRFAGIPHPAAFIVRRDRTIAAKLYEKDYVTNDQSYINRPEVGAVLAAADGALR